MWTLLLSRELSAGRGAVLLQVASKRDLLWLQRSGCLQEKVFLSSFPLLSETTFKMQEPFKFSEFYARCSVFDNLYCTVFLY